MGEMHHQRWFSCDIRWIYSAILWTLILSWAHSTAVDPQQQPLSSKQGAGGTLSNTSSVASSQQQLHCYNTRNALINERGFGDIPREAITGDRLKVCSVPVEGGDGRGGLTCCTAQMERALAARARQDFDQNLQNAIQGKLTSVLQEKATQFDKHFKTLMTDSKRNFHDMFMKTYGLAYEQNSHLTEDLFQDLEMYFTKGRVHLDSVMKTFFSLLYIKMFALMNQQFHFDNRYLECVKFHMDDLKPFGDSPSKTTKEIKRSFVATKAFAIALSEAAEVAKHMQEVHPPTECARALARMSGCNFCQGRPNLLPCPGFCTNVMQGCLAYHAELNKEWNDFVQSFVQVVHRLTGSFNIMNVMQNIAFSISEAVMHFQENTALNSAIFSRCGEATFARHRRSPSGTELQSRPYKFSEGGTHRNRNKAITSESPQLSTRTLELLITNIGLKVNETRNFWSQLPTLLCSKSEPKSKQDGNCWNGYQKAKYTQPPVVGFGIAAQQSNPEVRVNPSDAATTRTKIEQQKYSLRVITGKLVNAYHSNDVKWEDEREEDEEVGSGSGSGDYAGPDGKGPNEEYGSGDGSDGDDEDYSHGRAPPSYNPRPPPSLVPTPRAPKESFPHPPDRGHESSTTSSTPPTPRVAPISRFEVVKVMTAYFFPIVVVWFGGMFSEW